MMINLAIIVHIEVQRTILTMLGVIILLSLTVNL